MTTAAEGKNKFWRPFFFKRLFLVWKNGGNKAQMLGDGKGRKWWRKGFTVDKKPNFRFVYVKKFCVKFLIFSSGTKNWNFFFCLLA